MIDLKKIAILPPRGELARIEMDVVEDLLTQHELRFLHTGPAVPVVFMPLRTKKDYQDFCREPEWADFKKQLNDKWEATYTIKSLTVGFGMQLGKIGKTTEQTCRNAVGVIGKWVGMKTMQSLTVIISWHMTGYAGYDMFPSPMGENPYEPTVKVLGMGFVPRRLKDRWIVGYAVKEGLDGQP